MARNTWLILVVILFLAAGLRFMNFQELDAHNPIFKYPIVDSKEYVDDAMFYLKVDFLGPTGSYFHPPFYSYFVAALFKILGPSVTAVKTFQIILDLLNLLLLFLIGRRIFSAAVGLIAAFLYAIYVPVIQFSVEILPPILLIFLLLSTILFVLKFIEAGGQRGKRYAWIILAGASMGLLIITLPSFMVCLPLIALWLFFNPKEIPLKRKTAWVAVFALVSLIPVGLTWARNTLARGESVLISHAGGINFFIGNNENVQRTVSIRPGLEWETLLMKAYENEEIKSYLDQSRYWQEKGLKFIKNHPIRWLGVFVKKTILFFNAHEFPRNFDTEYFSRYSWVLRMPVLRLNLAWPLAFVSVVFFILGLLVPKRPGQVWLLLGIVVAYALSISLVFVAGRYRLPIVPLILVMAAAALNHGFRIVEKREWKWVVVWTLSFLGFVLLTNLQFFKSSYPYGITPVHTEAMIASTLYDQDRFQDSEAYFRKALDRPADASTYELYTDYAKYWSKRGDNAKAVENFTKALELNPDNHEVLNALGFYAKMDADYDKAIEYLHRGREVAPCYPQIYLNLADCYIAREKFEEAIKAVESYYEYCPSPHPTIAFTLGKLYMDMARDWERASYYLKQAIRYPQGLETGAETYNRLGACHYYLKEYGEAEKAWLHGLKIDPGNRAIQANLSALRSAEK
jgi:tetratricopeptide (TPR) repeat protein